VYIVVCSVSDVFVEKSLRQKFFRQKIFSPLLGAAWMCNIYNMLILYYCYYDYYCDFCNAGVVWWCNDRTLELRDNGSVLEHWCMCLAYSVIWSTLGLTGPKTQGFKSSISDSMTRTVKIVYGDHDLSIENNLIDKTLKPDLNHLSSWTDYHYFQHTDTHTLRSDGHFSRWTWVSWLTPKFSFSIYCWTVHPFGTDLNFPCHS